MSDAKSTVTKVFEILRRAKVPEAEIYVAASELVSLIHEERGDVLESVLAVINKPKEEIK